MDSQEYRSAQRVFYNWVKKWAHLGKIDEACEPDVLEIISLLQTIGYKVKFFETNKDENPEMAPISGGGGIRMIISCTHSGFRACLELPTDCYCPKVTNSSFWEVTGNAPNNTQEIFQETGSDLLLPISKGTKDVISQVIMQLMCMIKSDQNQNDPKTPNRYSEMSTRIIETPGITVTNSSFQSCSSMNLKHEEPEDAQTLEQKEEEKDIKYIKEPDDVFVKPEVSMSPARYRSLDTLTSDITSSELPEPGELHRETGPESLPNIIYNNSCEKMPQPSLTSSPNHNVKYSAYMKIRMAQEILEEVAQMLDGNSGGYFDVSKIRESCESLISISSKRSPKSKLPQTNKMKPTRVSSSPNLSKVTVVNKHKEQGVRLLKPQGRPPIRSNSTSSVQKVQTKPVVRSASTSEDKKKDCFKPLPPIKNLYANIKSTIPKVAKKEDKK